MDLFCCCGGAAKGFHDSGHEVTGVDITDNHEYPYEFIHKDVFDLDLSFFQTYDLIWASPPCQFYIPTNKNKVTDHPDLIPMTRSLLEKTGKPFIIENVPGAPIRKDLMLCGEMFGLKIIRHRLFEINGFTVLQPPHDNHKNSVKDGTAIALYSGGVNPGFWGDKEKQKAYREKRKSNPKFSLNDWKDAIGIYHITKKEHLTQAIPPKYTEYISRMI